MNIGVVSFSRQRLFSFIEELRNNRHLVYELVKRDFKSRFTGSYLGIFWTILQPLMMMLIMWFVFGHGLKGGGSVAGGFVPYMFSAQIAWIFFSEAFAASTGVIIEYSFLVKKVKFRLSILPVVKILSSLLVHFVFVGIVILLNIMNGIYPTVYTFQLVYYALCLMLIVLGMSWLSSALNVFVRDTSNVVSIFIQFGFWLTPIFWNPQVLPVSLQKFVYLNPMTYVVSGYRDSLIYAKPIWEVDSVMTVSFWIVTVFFMSFGVFVFGKLRPHFADVI